MWLMLRCVSEAAIQSELTGHRMSGATATVVDVLPGLKPGDSRWRLTPLLGCFLFQHPLPQRVAVLHGLGQRGWPNFSPPVISVQGRELGGSESYL